MGYTQAKVWEVWFKSMIKRPFNAIGKLKAEVVGYINPGQPPFSGVYSSITTDYASTDTIIEYLNGPDDSGAIKYYIRDLFTQLGDEHIVHPGKPV